MEIENIFIQPIEKPACKVILKCRTKADGCWEYCQQAGCDVWGILTSMKPLCGEPVRLWDDQTPRTQLEPVGTQGYVELKAIKSKEKNR